MINTQSVDNSPPGVEIKYVSIKHLYEKKKAYDMKITKMSVTRSLSNRYSNDNN